jgi:hypothetical protein
MFRRSFLKSISAVFALPFIRADEAKAEVAQPVVLPNKDSYALGDEAWKKIESIGAEVCKKVEQRLENGVDTSIYDYVYAGDEEWGQYKKQLALPLQNPIYHTKANGDLHCESGPAIIYTNGDKYWFQNNMLHRLDGPAIEISNGTKIWGVRGQRYTEEEFNKIVSPHVDSDGVQTWSNNKMQLHRENGPAIIYPNSDMEWWVDGRRHRLAGPAVLKGKISQWYRNGVLHRLDGPAFINQMNGYCEYYINGKYYSKEEYYKKQWPYNAESLT